MFSHYIRINEVFMYSVLSQETMHINYVLMTYLYIQNATMQAILATDGLYSYVMFNYDQEQWTLSPEQAGDVAAGYSNPSLYGHITANNGNFSLLTNNSNVEPGKDIYN